VAITVIRGAAAAGANNPLSGSWNIAGSGWAANDILMTWWYTMTNTKTITENVSGPTLTELHDVNSAGFGRLFIGWRILQGGDAEDYGWSSSTVANSTTHWGDFIARGVDTGSPWEQNLTPSTWANAVNPDAAAVTTVTDGALVLALFGKNNDYTTYAVPTNYTAQGNASSTAGTDASAGLVSRIKSPAGSEDPGAWTLGGGAATDDGYVWTGALKPAAAAAPASLLLPNRLLQVIRR
jgi:hypothetical protein